MNYITYKDQGKNLPYQLNSSHQRQNIIQFHSHFGVEIKGNQNFNI